MRDIVAELKGLRLHGMVHVWEELQQPGQSAVLDSSRWLIDHLLDAEHTDRAMRSISHQMHAAKFPMHRELASFDFDVSPVERKLIGQLATLWRLRCRHITSCWWAAPGPARPIWPQP